MMLVTVDETKPHLNVDYDASDELIEWYIKAASEAVLNYLKDTRYDFTDTSGEILQDSSGADLTPFVVKQAVVLLVDEFFAHRGSDGGKEARWEMGYLPPNVMAVLYPLRDPAYA